jgi:hypothetical protein
MALCLPNPTRHRSWFSNKVHSNYSQRISAGIPADLRIFQKFSDRLMFELFRPFRPAEFRRSQWCVPALNKNFRKRMIHVKSGDFINICFAPPNLDLFCEIRANSYTNISKWQTLISPTKCTQLLLLFLIIFMAKAFNRQ